MLLPPGPEPSWLMMTLRRSAHPRELASSTHIKASQNLLHFLIGSLSIRASSLRSDG